MHPFFLFVLLCCPHAQDAGPFPSAAPESVGLTTAGVHAVRDEVAGYVKNGTIVTRALSNDILHGITRAAVLRFAGRSEGSCLSEAFFFFFSRSLGASRWTREPISRGFMRPTSEVGAPSGSLSRRGKAERSAVRTRDDMAA